MKTSRSEFLTVRGMRTHVRHWGADDAPVLFMLHGWMDVSASFQFVVDSLAQDWHVVAPDARGFGLSAAPSTDTYWFPDYLGDLDAVLDHYAPAQAVNLVGHSMGGNVATLYAGVRPARVASLVNLEGFGMPTTQPGQAPAHYAKWLDELRAVPGMRTYASQAEVAAMMQKNNARLSDARAAFLSGHWASQTGSGRWEIRGDPRHKSSSPVQYRVEEAMACWAAVSAPVLWVEAGDSTALHRYGTPQESRAEIARRKGFLARLSDAVVEDAGHMLHHDQPEIVARLIEEFVAQHGTVASLPARLE